MFLYFCPLDVFQFYFDFHQYRVMITSYVCSWICSQIVHCILESFISENIVNLISMDVQDFSKCTVVFLDGGKMYGISPDVFFLSKLNQSVSRLVYFFLQVQVFLLQVTGDNGSPLHSDLLEYLTRFYIFHTFFDVLIIFLYMDNVYIKWSSLDRNHQDAVG